MIRLAAALALLCGPAWAQNACAAREQVIARLQEGYSERFDGGGVQNATTIFEVWVSDSGSWTILRTHANGMSCIMASGQNWREGSGEPVPQGEDG